MNRIHAATLCALAVLPACSAGAEDGPTLRLKATADIWVSSFPKEELFTAGRYPRFKLKSIQELGVIRFDASAAAGRAVKSARLLLHPSGQNMLRHIRVSTCATDWAEGTNAGRLTAGDGASYNWADNATRAPWAWPGSQLCDAIMGSGNTRAAWAERKLRDDGWISVELAPELVYSLVAGDTDGLAVMDGGTPAFFNNFIDSVQSKSPPCVEVVLGEALTAAPKPPKVRSEPDGSRAHVDSGAIRVTIAPDAEAFCYRLELDGRPVQRWRVKHPNGKSPTVFSIEDLTPSKGYELSVVAVGRGGGASAATKVPAKASPALAAPPRLAAPKPPGKGSDPPKTTAGTSFWAAPPLVKIDPLSGEAMFGDTTGNPRRSNAVWDGNAVRLFAARGETVSFQVVVEHTRQRQPWTYSLHPAALKGADGAEIGTSNMDLFRNWYAQNKSKRWQPAYCVPIKAAQAVVVPDPGRKLDGQSNQSFWVDVSVPRGAKAGAYHGSLGISANDRESTPAGWAGSLPVRLEVLDFDVPDELCFWPQLNSYSVPEGWHDYFRLARDNRCVWYYRFGSGGPAITGKGKDLRIDWAWWDRMYGPLLSGEAFKGCRGGPRPIETIALPFWDSWPTPLTKDTYRYTGHWPGKGEDNSHLIEHYLKAPYIGQALSQDYKDAFLAAQRQFVEHFKEKGWTGAEAQCVFVGKITHRTQYGINMWFHTDEPYHWDDWLALRFFDRLWRSGRGALGADPARWTARADISRPQWQDRVLAGAADNVYFGGFARAVTIRRCQILARESPLDLRVYGSASADDVSATASLAWILSAWLNGASAALPWQALGSDKALDANDSAVGGNALICPGTRFGTGPVADIRLKAFRDAEQLCHYLKIVQNRHGLNREQLRAMVAAAVKLEGSVRAGASADNADALVFSRLKAWQIAGLRRGLANLILSRKGSEN